MEKSCSFPGLFWNSNRRSMFLGIPSGDSRSLIAVPLRLPAYASKNAFALSVFLDWVNGVAYHPVNTFE